MKNSVLIAPLNWGLGHATRCIPIINALIAEGFQPHIASDGMALELLRKEFPDLPSHELPSYDIRYSKKKKNFRYKLLLGSPKIVSAIKKEKSVVAKLVDTIPFAGIISDNRFGVYHKKIPSVFISHQLHVLSGNTTWFSTGLHRHMINKFDECWVPDYKDEPNLSGILGHAKLKIPLKYLGALSRFERRLVPKKTHLLVLLSGPEPQRQLLEDLLIEELQNFKGKLLLVRGVVEGNEELKIIKGIPTVNYLTSGKLEEALNATDLVLCRSGYTSIMDLKILEKKAFFIPTPGQFEQQYLAERLERKGIAPYCDQDEFSLSELIRLDNFTGFKIRKEDETLISCFGLFKGK